MHLTTENPLRKDRLTSYACYNRTEGGQNIKIKKALFLTLWVHSLLVWLYVVSRIIVNHVPLNSPFIDAIPFLTFTVLGIIAFVLSMIFMFMYLKES